MFRGYYFSVSVRSNIGTLALTTLISCYCQLRAADDPTPSPSEGALEAIESERGGRHWVDLPTDPPKSPAQSLAAIQIENGFRIELFAAEPLVIDPVAIAFDARGRMFVAEYSDYPIGPPAGGDPLSKIVMLEDTDHDGVADQRHLFADKLDFANSLMAYKDGLLVAAKTKLLYLKDSDGDHVADVRETLFDGFTPAHPQMQISNPRWGIDNWVYCNYGPGKVVCSQDSEHPMVLPRKDFRFHPLSLQFGADSGLGQYGNTIDRWGNRFYCTNRNPIITTFLPPEVLARNPYHVVTEPFYDVGKSGGETRVFPLLDMKSNYLSHAGTHTAACGTTAYLGQADGEDLRNSVFVCEPIGHLVTRSIVRPHGLRLEASRAEPTRDFLASTDRWFRPSSLANGPDGALYLADMYRLWVEHPKFLPPEIAAKLDWRAGEDRGRIYRVVAGDTKANTYVPPQSVEDCVALLSDPIGWRQFLGQRLLVQQQSAEAAALTRPVLRDKSPTTRLHALWTLDGLSALQPSDVIASVQDANPNVRIAAVKLARQWLDSPKVFRAVASRVDDPEIRVRFQLALTLSASESEQATVLLGRLAVHDGHDPWFADGLLTSTRDRSFQILESLLADELFVTSADSIRIDLFKQLATVIGARGDLGELSSLLKLVSTYPADANYMAQRWKIGVISGLAQGLPRYQGDVGPLTLAKLISDPPQGLAAAVAELKLRLQEYSQLALDSDQDSIDRAAAVELLGLQPFSDAGESLSVLLGSDQPLAVQTASLDALASSGSVAAAEIVLHRWEQLRPALQSTALGFLLRRADSTRMTLDAMAAGRINPAVLSIDQRVLLLKHSDPDLRRRAIELFGGAVSANRREVTEAYTSALSISGSASEGQQVFARVCAACHRKDGKGNEAGPDLSDVRNRSKPSLLYDILDPNAKVEPRFMAYSVLTTDGRVFSGLLDSESEKTVVLKMAEGKRQTIGRAEIAETKTSSLSLMPEGIEKEISTRQMADLLEYLKHRE